MHGIVARQVGIRFRIAEIVDGNDLYSVFLAAFL